MMYPFFDPTLITATSGVIAIIVIAAALLHAWQGWLELKRQELDRASHRPATDEGHSFGTARIELADLRERIRKLEAIASGVEL